RWNRRIERTVASAKTANGGGRRPRLAVGAIAPVESPTKRTILLSRRSANPAGDRTCAVPNAVRRAHWQRRIERTVASAKAANGGGRRPRLAVWAIAPVESPTKRTILLS